jgi:hypothetical protein
MKITLNVKKYVVKVAKCKLSSILTSIQNAKYYKCTNCKQTTEQDDSSGNWPMSNLLETIKRVPKIKKILKNKNESMSGA